ncbi:MAG: zinc-ribbon domain-containing protein, partial [Methanobrevibacter sp.]|nr:zinc-ribbon domain-containing protein [Candidatus Methanovirga meridionalis]
MKIVVCEHCGAKFRLEDNEFPYNFECSVCAGNLVDENGSNQSLDPWYLKSEKDNSDTYVVKCKNCGLRYVLNSNEKVNDYQCSICSGDLTYFNEEEIIPETDIIDTEITDDLNAETTDNTNTEITDDLNLETTDNTNTEITDDSNLETTDNINTEITDDLNLETTDNINTEITDDLNLETTDN